MTTTRTAEHFDQQYQTHLKHLKLKGLQPKTIEAYSRAIRRLGEYFGNRIDDLGEAELTNYFTDLVASHSWSTVKLDLYGLKFYYAHVLKKPWVAPGLIKPPRSQRLPDIVTIEEAKRLFAATRVASYHPHVHLVMPAAAVDGQRRRWRSKRRGKGKGGYLFNHKALAKVFRGKLLAAIEAAGLTLPCRHPETWVVDCKSVGSGRTALIYLGRYLYRGVIAEKDIVAVDGGQVSFRYRNAKFRRMERRTVSGAQFLWLVLQHVLPKGFRRARNFGFLHPNCKRLIALLQVLLKFAPAPVSAWFKTRAPILCGCCGAVMVIVRTRIRAAPSASIAAPIVAAGTL